MNYFSSGNFYQEVSSYKLHMLVEAELKQGEHIIWLGQPIPWRMVCRALPKVFACGSPILAFAFLKMRPADMEIGRAIMLYFSALAVVLLFGAVLTFFKAKRTAYVLTESRAVIFSVGWLGKITPRSFALRFIKVRDSKVRANGSGNLVFTRDAESHKEQIHFVDAGFLEIRDVRATEETLRMLAAKAPKPAAGPKPLPSRPRAPMLPSAKNK